MAQSFGAPQPKPKSFYQVKA